MTREQVRAIIGEGATEVQIDAILNAHSADVGDIRREGREAQDRAEELEKQLSAAQEAITRLENASEDVEQLRAELVRYRDEEQQRSEAERAAAAEQQLRARFEGVAKGAAFVNDFTREGVYAQFKAAITDVTNAGHGDAELYAAIVKDKPGLMANPNPAINIPGPASLNNRDISIEAYKQMPLHEQMKWANTNPELYARLSAMMN